VLVPVVGSPVLVPVVRSPVLAVVSSGVPGFGGQAVMTNTAVRNNEWRMCMVDL
jgi:hypothetical protein